MADVRRDFEVAAGRQNSRLLLPLDPHARRAAQNDEPFGPVLIVPEAGRARLPGRDDPFDAGAGQLGEDRGLLDVEARRKVGEQVAAFHRLAAHAWLWAPACSTLIAVSIFSSPPLWELRAI